MHTRSLHIFGRWLALMILIGCAQAPTAVVTPTPPRLTPTPPRLTPTSVVTPTPPRLTPTPETTRASIAIVSDTLQLAAITPLATREIVDRPLRNVRALTDGATKYRLAQWSPDGAWIAATPQDGPGLDAIKVATGDVVRVVSDTYVLEPIWIDDSTLLTHGRGATGDALIAYRLDDPRAIAESVVQETAQIRGVGADGGLIAYGVGGALRLVSHQAGIDATLESLDPIISAPKAGDGAMLAAINPFVANLEQIQTFVVRLTAEQTQIVTLSERGEGLWLPRWSPDATRLALTSIEARIVTMTIDGAQRHDLGPGDQPAWSPDGQWIAYVGANAGTEWISRDLYLVDWQGQKPRQRLTRVGDGEFFSSPSWSPDGGRIAFVELDSGRVFVGDMP